MHEARSLNYERSGSELERSQRAKRTQVSSIVLMCSAISSKATASSCLIESPHYGENSPHSLSRLSKQTGRTVRPTLSC